MWIPASSVTAASSPYITQALDRNWLISRRILMWATSFGEERPGFTPFTRGREIWNSRMSPKSRYLKQRRDKENMSSTGDNTLLKTNRSGKGRWCIALNTCQHLTNLSWILLTFVSYFWIVQMSAIPRVCKYIKSFLFSILTCRAKNSNLPYYL